MNPLVSILVPAHDAARWLRPTLESALAQTWRRIQVVVVDDGSSDTTLAIAKRYASHRLQVVSQPNSGASAARNRALSLADGDYIQWLDGDDVLAPDKIERQLRRAADGDSRILLTGPFGQFLDDPSRARFRPTPLWRDLEPIDFFLTRFVENAWMFPAAWLVTRELTERVGPWDERLSLDDDGEYFARLVAACDAIRFVPDARSYYRRANTGSLSRTISESAAASLLLSMRLCIDYLLSLEDSRRTRSAALRFLQTWIDRGNCFDPGRPELFAQLSSLAGELGGSVSPPRLSWKYRPVQALFGWPAVRWLRGTVSNARLRVRVELERLRPFRVERGMYANPEQRGSS